MKIYNEEKTQELNEQDLDFTLGYLKSDKRLLSHHDAVEGRNAVYADRIVEEENGGVSVYKDLVTPAVEAKEEWDEYENIQVYIPYTAEELKERADKKRHAELKAELEKVMEDIEQEHLGIVRDDYSEKKARAAVIINELRVLEGKAPREVVA